MMNALLGFASAAERLQRLDAIRRKNAEQAYDKQTEFRELADKTKKDLEALLRGDEPRKPPEEQTAEFQKLNGGQLKNVAIPLGKNLEETIDMWRSVRSDAYSETPPTTADYQLASEASAKINEAEFQIALHNRAKSIREQMTASGLQAALPHKTDSLSIYKIQGEARTNGYQIEQWPLLNVSV